MYLKDIDLSRIEFPILKKLIQTQIQSGVILFSDLKSTEPTKKELEDYGFVEDQYEYDFPIQKVFNHYKTSNPSVAWNSGGLISYGLGLDKNSGEIYYPGDDYPGAKVGQVLYLHSLILGLKELCMAQELVKVDDTNFIIVFSYIQDGMTKGIQEMKFTELTINRTMVTHTSRFKGVSSFRDVFYPFFHSMIVSKFHGNLKKSLNN